MKHIRKAFACEEVALTKRKLALSATERSNVWTKLYLWIEEEDGEREEQDRMEK